MTYAASRMTPTPSRAMRRVLVEDHLGASTFVEKGWNLIAIGNFAGAEVMLRRALVLAPSDIRGRALLGWARMRQGMYDDALRLLSQLLAENSLNAMALVNLGYVWMRKGEIARAAELLEHSSRQTRDPKAALYANFYLGLLFAGEENFAGAENSFGKCILLAPNFVEGYYELGRAQLSAGRLEAARRTWSVGHEVNRFNIWGKRCAEAIRLAYHGEQAPSYS